MRVNYLYHCATLTIIAWSYYAYVSELYINIIYKNNPIKSTVYITAFNILTILLMWSYFKVICSDIATVPYEYKLPRSLSNLINHVEAESKQNKLLLEFCQKEIWSQLQEQRRATYCKKCQQIKPDRAHHCSKCATCVLKMDHHCPLLNKCIGLSNYKFYILFLIYNCLYCGFYFLTAIEYFVLFSKEMIQSYSRLQVTLGFAMSSIFSVLLIIFCFLHLSQIADNQTTLEALRAPVFSTENGNATFNIGISKNFSEVFGDNYLLALLPINTTKCDGINYPLKFIG